MAVRAEIAVDRTARPHASLRTCIVTREARPPDELVRFVLGPDGQVVPDLARRLPGRGVWVTASRAAIAQAIARKAFARAFRRQVSVPADLPEIVERLLVRRAMDSLSLANKAGLVTTGFTRIEAALSSGGVTALLHAAEASPDGAGKLDRRFLAVSSQIGRAAPLVRELTLEQLSLALGRSNVIHAALSAGGATTKFLNEASRVTRYRSGAAGQAGETAAHGIAASGSLEMDEV